MATRTDAEIMDEVFDTLGYGSLGVGVWLEYGYPTDGGIEVRQFNEDGSHGPVLGRLAFVREEGA